MDADALDLALEPGNKHASGTEAMNTKCDIQDHNYRQMSHFYNIRMTNICSLSQDSHNYNSSMAQLFDWGKQASNDPDSDQRPAKSNNFEMISEVEAEDDSVDSDIVFISSNNSDSGMRRASKVKIGDNSVDSDIVLISSNSDSEITKVALHPLDNRAKSQLSSLQTDRGQKNKDNVFTDDPENLVCDTEVLECLHRTTHSKKKHQVVRSPLQKGPEVMNRFNTPILINGAMQQVRDENKSDEDRSNVQTVKNPEESSNVFCCVFGWSAKINDNILQCSCESRHKDQTIDSSPKYHWNLESKDCSSVKPITQCEVSTKHGTTGMQYHCKTSKGKCKTTSAGPWLKYTQLEGHGLLGSSSGYKSEIGTTSKKGTRTKKKKEKQTAKNRSTCVTAIKKTHK